MGGAGSRFPDTRHSAVLAVRDGEPEVRRRAIATLIAAYWKPAYKYLRIAWKEDNENAKDLVQGFFAKALEKGYFAGYDPQKAAFRTFLRVCLDGYVANERKAAARQKRGGGINIVALDFDSAESELLNLPRPDGQSMEDLFHQEWVRHLFSLAVEELRGAVKDVQFRLFTRYDLDGDSASYKLLAEEFGIPATQVTNHLAAARREFRRIVLAKLAELTASDEEFRAEARRLLGVRK
jgi:RNA polymerase sigma factor (sigma-70 family)